MFKYLSAKEKARELGITTSGLAKTRHLYKHIRKSPHKYLYFKEDPQDIVRPISNPGPNTPGNSRTPRSNRRRGVPFGEENYHKAPGGSGNSLKLLNQMRAKASLEGKVAPGDLKYLDGAMAIKIKDNAQQIVEQEQNRKRSKLLAEEERIRRRDPKRYGRMIRGNRSKIIDVETPWTPLFPKEPDEYDRYSKEHFKDEKKFEYY